MKYPIGARTELSDPRRPTASGPSWRWRVDPAARHRTLYTRKQEEAFPAAEHLATTAGIRFLPQFAAMFPRLETPRPGELVDRSYVARRDRARLARVEEGRLSQGRLELSAPLKLRPGLGGADYAQAMRYRPGTRDGYAGAFRTPDGKIHGKHPQGTPPEVWDRMADTRREGTYQEGGPLYPVQGMPQVNEAPRWQPLALVGALAFVLPGPWKLGAILAGLALSARSGALAGDTPTKEAGRVRPGVPLAAV
jgi:hypothetical protein